MVMDSMNSLDYSEASIRLMLSKKIKELKLEMPPTRDGLARLFEALNLYATTVTCIDCLLFCRGHKLEKSNPDDFNIDKMIQWFSLNIRTLKHINYEGVDPEWVEEYLAKEEMQKNTLPLPPLRPHPQFYLKKHSGTGGVQQNRIITMSTSGQNVKPAAFEKYGMFATQMAQSFSINSKISQKQKLKFRNFHALSNNPKTNREKDVSIQSSIDDNVTYGPIINEVHTTKNAPTSFMPFEQVRKTAPHHQRFQTLNNDRLDIRNAQSHHSERMQSANTCHKASERRYDLEKDS